MIHANARRLSFWRAMLPRSSTLVPRQKCCAPAESLITIVQSTLLTDAHKSQAELEVQLNVAKSNLQLVISNNELLEDALKREGSTQSRVVGWRRTSGRDDNRSVLERSQSMDYAYTVETPPRQFQRIQTTASSSSGSVALPLPHPVLVVQPDRERHQVLCHHRRCLPFRRMTRSWRN